MIALAFIHPNPFFFVGLYVVFMGGLIALLASGKHAETVATRKLDERETSRVLYPTTGRQIEVWTEPDHRVIALMHLGVDADEAVEQVYIGSDQ